MSWHHLQRGADAADEALSLVFGITQKDRSPKVGFEAILRKLTLELLKIANPVEQDALKRCLHALDVNWAGLRPEQRTAAIERAARALEGVPELVVNPVIEALSREGRSIVMAAKQGRYDLPVSASFNTVDQKVIDHAAQSHAFYVRDEYGKRQAGLAALARDEVSRGLSQGLDNKEIGRGLRVTMQAAGTARSESYWSMIASVFSTRSRTWGSLSSFTEAGIETYEISDTGDEVECDVCRFMHGKKFSTKSAVARYQKVAESEDPESVVDLQPFISVGVNEDGEKALFYGRGETRKPIARVTDSALGEKDSYGSYSHAISDSALEAAGVSAPPFHPSCRCLLVPSG